MKIFASAGLPKNPSLIVVLHGCDQTPESLDAASGFSRLAKQRGFVLVYPQQRRSNNPHQCFNWFRPSAATRDRGEVLSIWQMIDTACKQHRVDHGRIYIVGLSAGGAMTAALVAAYPSLFAGAAIIGGMPFGAVRDALSALRAMKDGAVKPKAGWGIKVTEASPSQNAWPQISIWHGTADRVVNPANAQASVEQWLEANGLEQSAGHVEQKPWGELHSWKAAAQRVAFYSISGMGHGLPVKVRGRKTVHSTADRFVLPADISAPLELMRCWDLPRL